MKNMKRTFAIMVLTAVLSAIAGQSMAQEALGSITTDKISGGSVFIYGSDKLGKLTEFTISEAAAGSTVYLETWVDVGNTRAGLTWDIVISAPSSGAESRMPRPTVM